MDAGYSRKNLVQTEKVRIYIRKNSYLTNPKSPEGHHSIDGKLEISTEMLSLEEIALKNISTFINGKKNNEKSEKLIPVYVTENEKIEGEKLENKTIKDLKVMIFEKINTLPTERQELQEEIYEKTVKNKKKNQFVAFYQLLCELEENESTEQINEIEEE